MIGINRRKHIRTRVKEGVIAVLSNPGNLFMQVGWIQDMSEGGIGLLCPEEQELPEGLIKLEALGHGTGEAPISLSGRLVYKARERSGIVRCGIQFLNDTDKHLVPVRHFIDTNRITAA